MGTTPVVKYPERFICPITHEVMEDPVMDPDGNSYERRAIIHRLSRDSTSPITRNPLTVGDLVPNQILLEAIEQFKTHRSPCDICRVVMNTYHNNAGVCIWDGCIVTMSDGRPRFVKNIRRGDIIWGGAKVVCVVKSVCKNSQAEMIQFENGLVISPWHPIRLNGKHWHFPCEVGGFTRSIVLEAKEVYNFVLDSQHTMIVNGIECATLGHYFKGEVIEHGYYGTEHVIKDLKALAGWKSGCVVVMPCQLIRNRVTGLATGIKNTYNASNVDSG
ncbi:unnamed protein product [Didymodactylos carnosus]|uniref:U-box domain-containing protein n=1 Tax=Didymodactylos carnosus TaxID=1234261 RepID=A0A815MB58_9BILA|nr:unnamed protein product [Didymodactylos carnosus]CAF1418147.1 unnamed protein product [Didymodactylos carnosus]CAF4049218.1 unnamed protein product [Didymodactylos carnosus]CAF4302917.1 unnamed protein product [Didymodactylos carnosus]